MISLKIGGIIVAAFVAGAFVASPELRAYAANTVGSSDIIDESILSQDIKNGEVKSSDLGNNAVTAAKIKDGEVKAAEIATDAVGASEILGVSKLVFGQCKTTSEEGNFLVPANSEFSITCNVPGVDDDDSAIASLNGGGNCFYILMVDTQAVVNVVLHNKCSGSAQIGAGVDIGIIVFDK